MIEKEIILNKKKFDKRWTIFHLCYLFTYSGLYKMSVTTFYLK